MNYTEKFAASIDEALADEKFLEKLHNAGSKEEIAALFATEKGIELSDTDAQDAFDKLESIKNGSELAAEDLELVAGGCVSLIRRLGSFSSTTNTYSWSNDLSFHGSSRFSSLGAYIGIRGGLTHTRTTRAF